MSPAGEDGDLQQALEQSFAAESQGRERYAVFAARALAQGFPEIAHLLRVITRGEELHAQRHLKAARGVGKVADNLRLAVENERADVERYSEAKELARAASNRRAEQAFEFAEGVDLVHGRLLEEALEAAESGQDLQARTYLLCKVCGYVELGDRPPDFCPVCGSPAEVFSPVG
jgi:rubrerythrin